MNSVHNGEYCNHFTFSQPSLELCVLLDKQDEPAPSWITAGLLAQAGHSPKPQIRLQTPTKQTAEVAHLSRFLVLREYHPHTMAV